MKSKMHSVEARYHMQAMKEQHERKKKWISVAAIAFYLLCVAFVAGAAIISGGKP